MCFSMPAAMSSMVTAGPRAFPAGAVAQEDVHTARLVRPARVIRLRLVFACIGVMVRARNLLARSAGGLARDTSPPRKSQGASPILGRFGVLRARPNSDVRDEIGKATDSSPARWSSDAPFAGALPCAGRPTAPGLKQNISPRATKAF